MEGLQTEEGQKNSHPPVSFRLIPLCLLAVVMVPSLTVLVSFLSGLGGYDMLALPEGLGRVMNDIYNLLCHLLVV